jgi:hypothetical protein
MVTGDNIITAKAIAQQCGIYTPGGIAIEGPEFRQLSHDRVDELIPNLQGLKCLRVISPIPSHGDSLAKSLEVADQHLLVVWTWPRDDLQIWDELVHPIMAQLAEFRPFDSRRDWGWD